MATVRPFWLLIIKIVICVVVPLGLYFGYRSCTGWPATPMSVSEAKRLFGNAVTSESTVEDVRNWLSSQSIPCGRKIINSAPAVTYEFDRRQEGKELSIDYTIRPNGTHNVAELAGLQNNKIHSIIRVHYPDANRFPLGGWSAIIVLIYFDAEGRVIGRWIHENDFGPGGTPNSANL